MCLPCISKSSLDSDKNDSPDKQRPLKIKDIHSFSSSDKKTYSASFLDE